MKDFTVTACASPWLVGGGPSIPSWIPEGPLEKTLIKPYVFEVPPLEFHWRRLPPGSGPYRFHENLTVSPKPL